MVMKVPQAVSVVLKDHLVSGTGELLISDLDGLTNAYALELDSSDSNIGTETTPEAYDYGT